MSILSWNSRLVDAGTAAASVALVGGPLALAPLAGGSAAWIIVGLVAAGGLVLGRCALRLRMQVRALRGASARLEALSARVDEVREEERARVAVEVNEGLGQRLAALKLDVAWVRRRLPEAEPDVRERMERLGTQIDDLLDRVRAISADLRPGMLDTLGLVEAIEWQARQFEQRTGIACALDLETAPLDRPRTTGAFRIFQEALANVAQHAAASEVLVALRCRGRRVVLTLRDNGRGISEEALASARSVGLTGMREGARRLGGQVTIVGGPGEGTQVVLELPLAES
jgi:signal transduction histidine kinase